MAHATKISAQKKQLLSILSDKKNLYQTTLTLLKPDIVHKTVQKLYKFKYGFSKKMLKLGF